MTWQDALSRRWFWIVIVMAWAWAYLPGLGARDLRLEEGRRAIPPGKCCNLKTSFALLCSAIPTCTNRRAFRGSLRCSARSWARYRPGQSDCHPRWRHWNGVRCHEVCHEGPGSFDTVPGRIVDARRHDDARQGTLGEIDPTLTWCWHYNSSSGGTIWVVQPRHGVNFGSGGSSREPCWEWRCCSRGQRTGACSIWRSFRSWSGNAVPESCFACHMLSRSSLRLYLLQSGLVASAS